MKFRMSSHPPGQGLLGVSLSRYGKVKFWLARSSSTLPLKYWLSAWIGLLMWVIRPRRKGVPVLTFVAEVGWNSITLCSPVLRLPGQEPSLPWAA